jgi:hypothetical protein
MRLPRRTLAIGAAVIAGAALISLHAAEQKARGPSAAGAAQNPGKPSAAPSPPAGLPPLPDADSIKDDPTVAPDPKDSADHNVSMPADI